LPTQPSGLRERLAGERGEPILADQAQDLLLRDPSAATVGRRIEDENGVACGVQVDPDGAAMVAGRARPRGGRGIGYTPGMVAAEPFWMLEVPQPAVPATPAGPATPVIPDPEPAPDYGEA
jgi:hypothetical protein